MGCAAAAVTRSPATLFIWRRIESKAGCYEVLAQLRCECFCNSVSNQCGRARGSRFERDRFEQLVRQKAQITPTAVLGN